MRFRKGSCVKTKPGIPNAAPTEPGRVLHVRRGAATVQFRDFSATYQVHHLRSSKDCA